MRDFARLIAALEQTSRSPEKENLLVNYFSEADSEDAGWALSLLLGRTPRRLFSSQELKELIGKREALPSWLVEESHQAVGDVAETISLLRRTPRHQEDALKLSTLMNELSQRTFGDEERIVWLERYWDALSTEACLVLHRLILGTFRAAVSENVLVRALARISGIDRDILSHRLMGRADWKALLSPVLMPAETAAQSYPFHPIQLIVTEPSTLGETEGWGAEWKWDGIRAQLIKRDGTVLLFSEQGENLSERFPDVIEAAAEVPSNFVFDGELLAWKSGAPLSYHLLQSRLTRRRISGTVLRDTPVSFMAFDCLEREGRDLRERSFRERRGELKECVDAFDEAVLCTPLLAFRDWSELSSAIGKARESGARGVLLKRWSSSYSLEGDAWHLWEVAPFSILAVLLYAQKGKGRWSNLFSNYTFGVSDAEELIPIATIESGLTEEETVELDRYIRTHATERFGPVRKVPPELLFEISFEGASPSPRHRSGLSLRFPRIVRWHRDRPQADAHSLTDVRDLLGVTRLKGL